MRNLKRVLSMALASAMVLGLTVVGASAATFSDQAEIQNTTAAAVLTTIGVLEGNENGEYMPNDILTREQAAKIICYMLMGPENAENLGTSTTEFSDVSADRWSAPYIAYCANMGILAGDGTGKFNPEDELTGHAFAKMLLVALGYDATIQNYTGTSWAINVASDAVTAGIFVSGTVLSDPLTRDNAAQMAFQTLTADMVGYSNKGTTIIVGGVEISQGASSAEKVVVSNESGYIAEGNNDTYQQFCEKYFPELTKEVTDSGDGLGRPAATWVYDGDEIVTVTDTAYKTLVVDDDYNTYEEALQDLLSSSASISTDGLYFNGEKLTDDDNETPALGDVMYVYKTTTSNETSTSNVYNVYVARYTYAVVDEIDTDVTTTEAKDGITAKITLELGDNSYTSAIADTDFVGFAYVEGDAIAVILNADQDEVLDSYAIDSVEGTVTARDTSANTVRLDGVKYELTNGVEASDIALGESYTLYLDANGYVIYAEGAEATASLSNLYYVNTWYSEESKYTPGSYTYYAQVVAMDGTVSEVKVYTINGETSDKFDSETTGKVETSSYPTGLYIMKSSSSGYKFTTLEDTADYSRFTAKETEITSSTVSLTSGTGTKGYLVSGTTYVVVSGDADDLTVKTYTGSASVSFSDGNAYVVTNGANGKSGNALYVVVVADSVSSAVDKSNLLFLDSIGEEVLVDGTIYYSAVAYDMDGTKMTITVDDSSYTVDRLYNYSVDDDDVYTLGDAISETSISSDTGYVVGTVTEVYNNQRVIMASTTGDESYDYAVSGVTVVDARSSKTNYTNTINSMSRLTTASSSYDVTAVMYVDDGYVTAIFVTDVAVAKDTTPEESNNATVTSAVASTETEGLLDGATGGDTYTANAVVGTVSDGKATITVALDATASLDGGETITVTLTLAEGATCNADDNEVTLTYNNDNASWSVSPETVTVTAADGMTKIVYTVSTGE